jgi:hypothetical protein
MFSRSFRVALVCLATMLVSAPARAQVLIGYLFGEVLTTPDFNVGFEVGLNFANLDGFDPADRVNRSVFGIFADWRFSEHLQLGGAVLPFAARGADGLTPVLTGDPAFDGQTAAGTMNRNLSYVEMPVLLRWAPQREEGFRIGAGPSFGWVTGATDRYEATSPAGTHYVLERDIQGQMPTLDFGISVDAEYRLPLVSIAVRYTHGLTDMRHDGAPDPIYSRVLTGTGRIYLGKRPSP